MFAHPMIETFMTALCMRACVCECACVGVHVRVGAGTYGCERECVCL